MLDCLTPAGNLFRPFCAYYDQNHRGVYYRQLKASGIES